MGEHHAPDLDRAALPIDGEIEDGRDAHSVAVGPGDPATLRHPYAGRLGVAAGAASSSMNASMAKVVSNCAGDRNQAVTRPFASSAPADVLRHQRRVGVPMIEAVAAIGPGALVEPARHDPLGRNAGQRRHHTPRLVRHMGAGPEGRPSASPIGIASPIGDGAGRDDRAVHLEPRAVGRLHRPRRRGEPFQADHLA